MRKGEDKGKTSRKLLSQLSKRGRFPPPLAAPVVLEGPWSHVWGECHIPGTVSGSGESVMKKCSFYLWLHNKQLQDSWFKTAGLLLSSLQLGRALQDCLFSAPWVMLPGSWWIPFQGSSQLRAQLGLQASGFISFHVDLYTSFSEAPLPQASSWHGAWVARKWSRSAFFKN